MGQTESCFSQRYDEHKRAFQSNSRTSNFAKLLEEVHSFDSINNTMQVLHHKGKGAHLNTIESFYIHVEHANRQTT